MNMIFYTPDSQRNHTVFTCDAAQEGPGPLLDVLGNPAMAILRAEKDVVMKTGVSVCHKFNRRYATGQPSSAS